LLAPPWLAAAAGIWAGVNLQLADLGDGGREDGQRSGGGARFGEGRCWWWSICRYSSGAAEIDVEGKAAGLECQRRRGDRFTYHPKKKVTGDHMYYKSSNQIQFAYADQPNTSS
jgi:hypothetical protein